MVRQRWVGNMKGPQGDRGPDGLPGTNAVPADTAVAGYIAGDAASQVQDAMRAVFAGLVPVAEMMTEAERADIQLATPLLDHTAVVQAAIKRAAEQGGGTVLLPPGRYNIGGAALVMLSRVHLFGDGAHLIGSGANTVIETGYLDTLGNVVSNVSEWVDDSTGGGNGDPTHHCDHATIAGLTVSNCAIGMRLHWFTQGSAVINCDIDATSRSIRASNSWGQTYRRNTIRATMHLSHYMDWTTIEENAFEGCDNIGLLIGTGGSWSMGIRRNGFHWHVTGEGTAIKFEGGARNTEIVGNHFESNMRHIYGGTQNLRGLLIAQNHLAATPYNRDNVKVRAIEFLSIRNSIIGPNDFELGGVTVTEGFDKKIVLDADLTFYNRVILEGHPTSGLEDLPYCTIRSTNLVEAFGSSGSLTSAGAQPTITPLAGTSAYTVEQYERRYNFVANVIPGCTLTRSGGTHTIDTTIDADANGVLQPAYFFFRVGGAATTFRVAGRIGGRFASAVFDARENLATGAAGPTVTFSNNAGKLRIVLTGLDNPSNISGFVKAI